MKNVLEEYDIEEIELKKHIDIFLENNATLLSNNLDEGSLAEDPVENAEDADTS